MSNIRMIVTDIDGTLVDSTEMILPALVKEVRRCQKAGIIFALATGRTKELADPFVRSLELIDPCVEANGAYILRGEECLKEHGFFAGPIRDILDWADQQGMTVTMADTKTERAARETEYVRFHQKIGGRYQILRPLSTVRWDTDRFHKIMIMDENRTGKIEEVRRLLKPFGNDYWITTYSDKAVELGPKGCNKATGVQELAALLGIDMQDVMACGDYRNDYEMISKAGYGVAVGNALAEIKAVARYVAKRTYAEGVIEAIQYLCFGETNDNV